MNNGRGTRADFLLRVHFKDETLTRPDLVLASTGGARRG